MNEQTTVTLMHRLDAGCPVELADWYVRTRPAMDHFRNGGRVQYRRPGDDHWHDTTQQHCPLWETSLDFRPRPAPVEMSVEIEHAPDGKTYVQVAEQLVLEDSPLQNGGKNN